MSDITHIKSNPLELKQSAVFQRVTVTKQHTKFTAMKASAH